MIKERIRGLALIVILGFLLVLPLVVSQSSESEFDVSTVLLKVSLKKDSVAQRDLNVHSVSGGEVTLGTDGLLGNRVSVSEENVIFDRGENRKLQVRFDSQGSEEGVYVGHIRISGSSKQEIVPVVLEVESDDVFFDSNLDIPPAYSEIEPGKKILSQVKIFDLISAGGLLETLDQSPLEITYSVHNLDGDVIISESESIVVDKQTLITKAFSLPENIELGQYVLSVVIDYKSSVGVASRLFSVVEEEKVGFFEGSSGDLGESKFIIFIIFFAAIFIIIMIFFVYLLKDRDKLILDFRDYNGKQLQTQRQVLTEQKDVLRKKGHKNGKIKKEVAKQIKKIKETNKKREGELKKLKKKGSVKEMKKKIQNWKKKGYGIGVLEYKLSGLSKKEMDKIIGKWRKRGYNV